MQNLYIKIPDGANVVIDKLYENGHSAFVVGGCVRDFILEKEPHDWDICTDALPEQVMQIFGEKNVIPTGIKHGTVTVLIGNDNYEVTTYRIDGMYSDGRRPDNVEFTQNLIEDLSRRDFSINAMAYNDKIGLIDPFDGISDIKNRRICCVGDPGKRFGEDYLRILRAIRFSSTFGFIIDKHTRMVAAINAPNLRMLANERVGAEIRKILCGRYAADVIDENKTSIAWVIPEIIDMVGCEQNSWNESKESAIPYKLCVPKHFLNAAGSAPVTVIPVIAMLRNTPPDYFGQNLEVIPWRTIVQHLLSEDDEQCVRFVLRKWEAANPEEAAFGNPLGYKDVSRRRYAEKLDSIGMTHCLYGDLENILPKEFSVARI